MPALSLPALHILNFCLQSVTPPAYASSHVVLAASYASLSTTHDEGGGGVGEDEGGGGVGEDEGDGGVGRDEGGGGVGDDEGAE
eukprot:scaffold59669_cov38-Phaeocystis_antarctica.AAC.1